MMSPPTPFRIDGFFRPALAQQGPLRLQPEQQADAIAPARSTNKAHNLQFPEGGRPADRRLMLGYERRSGAMFSGCKSQGLGGAGIDLQHISDRFIRTDRA